MKSFPLKSIKKQRLIFFKTFLIKKKAQAVYPMMWEVTACAEVVRLESVEICWSRWLARHLRGRNVVAQGVEELVDLGQGERGVVGDQLVVLRDRNRSFSAPDVPHLRTLAIVKPRISHVSAPFWYGTFYVPLILAQEAQKSDPFEVAFLSFLKVDNL